VSFLIAFDQCYLEFKTYKQYKNHANFLVNTNTLLQMSRSNARIVDECSSCSPKEIHCMFFKISDIVSEKLFNVGKHIVQNVEAISGPSMQ
jgi:rRNA-processing protein FCF1